MSQILFSSLSSEEKKNNKTNKPNLPFLASRSIHQHLTSFLGVTHLPHACWYLTQLVPPFREWLWWDHHPSVAMQRLLGQASMLPHGLGSQVANERRGSDSHSVLLNTVSLRLMTTELMIAGKTLKNPFVPVQKEFLLAILPLKKSLFEFLESCLNLQPDMKGSFLVS